MRNAPYQLKLTFKTKNPKSFVNHLLSPSLPLGSVVSLSPLSLTNPSLPSLSPFQLNQLKLQAFKILVLVSTQASKCPLGFNSQLPSSLTQVTQLSTQVSKLPFRTMIITLFFYIYCTHHSVHTLFREQYFYLDSLLKSQSHFFF